MASSSSSSSSSFQRTVCLFDWWLIHTQRNTPALAVAGFTSREQEAVRVFTSAPIAKRYDVFTLETSDGVCILLKGLINKHRCSLNGFPSHVSNSFLFGFPSNWHQQYALTTQHYTTISPTTPLEDASITHSDFEQQQHHSPKVSDNIAIHTSEVADPKQHLVQMNVSRRRSHRLRNLDTNQNNPASRVVIQTLDDENSNSLLPETIDSGWTVDASSAKLTRKMKPKRMLVCGLKTVKNKMNPVPLAPCSESNVVQINNCELRDASMSCLSGNEFQEQLDTNVTDKLGNGSVSKRPHQTPDSGHVKTKAGQETDAKEESAHIKKTKRKIIFSDTQVTPRAQDEKVKVSIVSPECLSYGRSRSGRLLLPVMEFWRNQMPVYDVDRKLTGIQEDIPVLVPSRGSRSEPQKKQKR